MRNSFKACFVSLSLLICVAFATPAAPAGSQPVSAPGTLPPDKELDTYLASNDWNSLGEALVHAGIDGEPFQRKVNWLQSRIDAGGGSFLTFMAIPNTWLLGQRQNVADPEKDLRLKAGMLALYTFELITVDGAKCKDNTAPGHRADELIKENRPVWDYLRRKPLALQEHIIDKAIALEKQTAPLRRDDDFMCRGGLEEMRAGMTAGKQHEISTPGGAAAKTIALETPHDWKPDYMSPEIYKPRQAMVHEKMKMMLTRLLKGPE